MQTTQTVRGEPGEPGSAGLNGRADALQAGQHALPCIGNARRIGRDEPERRAARQRLPQPQARAHALCLGGRRDLAGDRLAPRLRRERGWARGERLAPAGGDDEREPREHYADDHGEHMFALREGRGKTRQATAVRAGQAGGASTEPHRRASRARRGNLTHRRASLLSLDDRRMATSPTNRVGDRGLEEFSPSFPGGARRRLAGLWRACSSSLRTDPCVGALTRVAR